LPPPKDVHSFDMLYGTSIVLPLTDPRKLSGRSLWLRTVPSPGEAWVVQKDGSKQPLDASWSFSRHVSSSLHLNDEV
jgi:hypothetical protein